MQISFLVASKKFFEKTLGLGKSLNTFSSSVQNMYLLRIKYPIDNSKRVYVYRKLFGWIVSTKSGESLEYCRYYYPGLFHGVKYLQLGNGRYIIKFRNKVIPEELKEYVRIETLDEKRAGAIQWDMAKTGREHTMMREVALKHHIRNLHD